jgi:hypothetical protein
MTTSATDSPFTDADQLGADLADAKRSDTQRVSAPADAQTIVATFKSNAAAGAWSTLDRATVADRLALIVTDPDPAAAAGKQTDVPDGNGHPADTSGARVIQQGALNLCGPAALMSRWAYRDPVAFATFATQLFETGKAQIGSLAIAPGSELLTADYNAMLAKMSSAPSPQADWMILGALRNTTDLFWQPNWAGDPTQQVAGMTLASQLTDWFSATGIYAKVDNQANLMEEKGVAHAVGLDNLPGQDIVLLINANLIALAEKNSPDNSWILNQFPNHYVVLLNSPTASADQTTITLNVWTWGRTSLIGSTPDGSGGTITVSVADFTKNYYGAIVATMSPPSTP